MANVKTTLDTRRAKSDGTFNIIFRITHRRNVYTINSGISIQKEQWNFRNSLVIDTHPNSKVINVKIYEKHYKIQHSLLLLGDDFTIGNLRRMLQDNAEDENQEKFRLLQTRSYSRCSRLSEQEMR